MEKWKMKPGQCDWRICWIEAKNIFILSRQYKKAKGVNSNVVTTTSHNEHKDALFNNICIRHSMNRIQSKDHRTETCEIKKI